MDHQEGLPQGAVNGRFVRLLLALVLCGCGTASGQAPGGGGGEQPPAVEAAAKPFVVEGIVADGQGKPMQGVHIRVSGGMGTLMPVGEATSGSDGRYRVRFGPGMHSLDETTKEWGIGLQAASVFAEKPGFYESDLCTNGNLGMAGKDPGEKNSWGFRTDQIVLPGQPHQLNFVMLPAARIEGRLLDAQSRPIANQMFHINGYKLPPSSSVLASITTGVDGHFAFDGLPTAPLWFELRHTEGVDRDKHRHGIDLKSAVLDYHQAGVYQVDLVYTRSAGEAATITSRLLGQPDGADPDRILHPQPHVAGDAQPLPEGAIVLTHAGPVAADKRSLGADGHAVFFTRIQDVSHALTSYMEAVDIFAARYGTPAPPPDSFHLYVLNEKLQILADVPVPYAMIERGEMQWYRLRTPSIEVPERFHIALNFNPHQTKGIYLGLSDTKEETHSLTGLPAEGYEPWPKKQEWMVRLWMAGKPSGVKGTLQLADWRPPAPAPDPFKDMGMIGVHGTSAGKQSHGGAGPAVRIKPSLFFKDIDPHRLRLAGFRIYGSRYGSGYDPATTSVDAVAVDAKAKVLWRASFPYARFTYKPRWVDLVLEHPVAIADWLQPDGTLILGIDPHAHQTRGIYFHFVESSTHSWVLRPDHNLSEVKDPSLWMIQCYFVDVQSD